MPVSLFSYKQKRKEFVLEAQELRICGDRGEEAE